MIDWKTIKDLHANKKLEEIIGKWFGVDIFYTDKHGNIHSNILFYIILYQIVSSYIQFSLVSNNLL